MESVDAIKKGSKADNGSVSDPDIIVSLKVAADVEEKGFPSRHQMNPPVAQGLGDVDAGDTFDCVQIGENPGDLKPQMDAVAGLEPATPLPIH